MKACNTLKSLIIIILALTVTWPSPDEASAQGETSRASGDSSGAQANGENEGYSSMSGDGRYVAFKSWASNLVPNDTNWAPDIFVRDRVAGTTERVSVSTTGEEGNNSSNYATISADGRYVAFFSWATNLVPNDINSIQDVFVHDRQTGTTVRASVSSTGVEGNNYCFGQSHICGCRCTRRK